MSDSTNNPHENESVVPDFDDLDNLSDIFKEISELEDPQVEGMEPKEAGQAEFVPEHPMTEEPEVEIPVVERPVADIPEDATVKLSKKELKAIRKEQKRAAKKSRTVIPEEIPEEEERDYQPIRRSREGKRGCLGGLVYAVFIIASSIVLAVVGWMVASDVFSFNTDDFVAVVSIKEDDSISDVAEKLHEADLVKYKALFKVYAKISNASEKIGAGTYELGSNLDYRALVNAMRSGGDSQVTVEVTIPEGYTMGKIFSTLEEEGVCDAEELYKAAADYNFSYSFLSKETGDATRMEGYLFPDTYEFYMGEQAASVIDKFLSNFSSKFTSEMIETAEARKMTLHEIITLASLIEREAANDEERADIASVIYNRLNSNYDYLELDSTVYYAAELMDEEFDTELDSPYNTYEHAGLPAGPICNPGLSSINAALEPNSTSYMYFAYGVDGVSHFFTGYNEFLNFINSDQYDSGEAE
ncbi:MAG: endolytic transglycosylase MltG [Oscillospiraceae bacterium]|jgi:UPF0755 protein